MVKTLQIFFLCTQKNQTHLSTSLVGVQFLVKVLNESKLISKGSWSKPTKHKKKKGLQK